jgi:polar amino acid transport system substrate-binding protein
MKRVSYVLIGSMLVASMLLAACSAASPTATQAAATTEAPAAATTAAPTATEMPTITVATDATFPPFEMMNDAGDMIGIDIDLMNKLAEKIGVQIEWQNLPFDSVTAGISECQFDVAISGIYITDERMKTMLFTDPYGNAGLSIAVAKDDDTVTTLADLKGKSVAAQLGTSGEEEAKKIEDVTYKPYDSYELAFLDLANGQVDAVIADSPVADGYVKENPDKIKVVGEPFNSADYGIAVCMKETELRDQINAALKELMDDGTVTAIFKQYNP